MVELISGQDLWYCPADRRHGKGRLVSVDKVGRKYIYVSGMRCIPWDGDGYSVLSVVDWPYGTIYLSEDMFLRHMSWSKFSRDIGGLKLTLDQKQKILDIAEI